MTLKLALQGLRAAQRNIDSAKDLLDRGEITAKQTQLFINQMDKAVGDISLLIKLADGPLDRSEPSDDELAEFGWAQGDYVMTCRFCGKSNWFQDGPFAEKRSIRCRPCAVEMFQAAHAEA